MFSGCPSVCACVRASPERMHSPAGLQSTCSFRGKRTRLLAQLGWHRHTIDDDDDDDRWADRGGDCVA